MVSGGACAAVPRHSAVSHEASVELERTACLGTCPAYDVTIRRSGTVTFTYLAVGRAMKWPVGTRDSISVPVEDVTRLFDTIDSVGYWSTPLDSAGRPVCGVYITDQPTAIITVRYRGRSRVVRDYHGCVGRPRVLRLIEDQIDVTAHTARFLANAECDGVADSLRTADGARIVPGHYWLTMVADDRVLATAHGNLWLTPTSPGDRSPVHPDARPPDGDTAWAPLYGATDADLPRVGALNYAPDTGTYFVPTPSSRDPLYPGVIVQIQNWQPNRGRRQNALVIGSFVNRRPDGQHFLDGGGIVLWVRHFADGGFYGSWQPFGRREEGEGHFCAVPMSS
jgi:hypothetical protein